MARFLRSRPKIFTSSSSPILRDCRASSTDSILISDAFKTPSTPSARVKTAYFSSTSDTVARTMLPRSCSEIKSENGSFSSCLTPSEIRSRSESIARMTVSSSSPLLYRRTAVSPSSSHEISDRCTNPSMPPSRPMNIPKSVIDLILPDR